MPKKPARPSQYIPHYLLPFIRFAVEELKKEQK